MPAAGAHSVAIIFAAIAPQQRGDRGGGSDEPRRGSRCSHRLSPRQRPQEYSTIGEVLFASIHADPAMDYPFFWGHADERGTGAGDGKTLNLPLPRGTDIGAYLHALEMACGAVAEHGTNLLVLSFGADTFEGDPISFFELRVEDYTRIGSRIAALQIPPSSHGRRLFDRRAGTIVRSFLSGFTRNEAKIDEALSPILKKAPLLAIGARRRAGHRRRGGFYHCIRGRCKRRSGGFHRRLDFDTRIAWSPTTRARRDAGPLFLRLGRAIPKADRDPQMEFRRLNAAASDAVIWLALWKRPGDRLSLRSAHRGLQHHQKIVVIDDNRAACGGIDITTPLDTSETSDGDRTARRPAAKTISRGTTRPC